MNLNTIRNLGLTSRGSRKQWSKTILVVTDDDHGGDLNSNNKSESNISNTRY